MVTLFIVWTLYYNDSSIYPARLFVDEVPRSICAMSQNNLSLFYRDIFRICCHGQGSKQEFILGWRCFLPISLFFPLFLFPVSTAASLFPLPFLSPQSCPLNSAWTLGSAVSSHRGVRGWVRPQMHFCVFIEPIKECVWWLYANIVLFLLILNLAWKLTQMFFTKFSVGKTPPPSYRLGASWTPGGSKRSTLDLNKSPAWPAFNSPDVPNNLCQYY